jgi:hypothetical protein
MQACVPHSELQPLHILYLTGPNHTGFRLVQGMVEAGGCQTALEIAVDTESALQWLREFPFHVVLIAHDPPALDAADFFRAARPTSPAGQAWIVLTEDLETWNEDPGLCCELDELISLQQLTCGSLGWRIQRARERCQLLAENRLLHGRLHQRKFQEREEALRQLSLHDERKPASHFTRDALSMQGQRGSTVFSEFDYGAILRGFVLEGSERVKHELDHLAAKFAISETSPAEIVSGHAAILRSIIDGTSSGSLRHLATRADAFLIELLKRICENYQGRSRMI